VSEGVEISVEWELKRFFAGTAIDRKVGSSLCFSAHKRVAHIKRWETAEVAIRRPQLSYAVIVADRRNASIVNLRPIDLPLFERAHPPLPL